MAKKFKHDPQWAKAKTLCRLNVDDVRKAKELGLKPKTLMKNIPSPSQKWKLPVKFWIREKYEQRFGNQPKPKPAPKEPATNEPTERVDDVEIPF
jgi:hypothetical protein